MLVKHGRRPIFSTFEEFNNKYILIDNKAMSNIEIENIGRDISLIPIEMVMRSDTRCH